MSFPAPHACAVAASPAGGASRKGFTLLELLAAIAVLAILAALTLGAVSGARERTAIARARGELAALASALEEFKRIHGDYPQLGEFAQAAATPVSSGTGPGLSTVQAKLFNCLTGVFRAKGFGSGDRISGPNLLDVGKFSLNGTLTNQFLVPVSDGKAPPYRQEQNACLLDPWGRRYLYYYKVARNPSAWQAPGYVLYSAGAKVAPGGTQTPPLNPLTGLMLPNPSAEVADNLYANP